MQIEFWLETNRVGSHVSTRIEVDDDEWNDLTEVEREDYAKQIFWDVALSRLGEWDWKVTLPVGE